VPEAQTHTLTAEQINALADAVELARCDQREYQQYGHPQFDYGEEEWPEAIQAKARTWRRLAEVMQLFEFNGLAKDCEELSEAFEQLPEDLKKEASG
jgi:hypothetical protein